MKVSDMFFRIRDLLYLKARIQYLPCVTGTVWAKWAECGICAKCCIGLPRLIKCLLFRQVFWSKMGVRFVIESMHRVQNAENNHWDNRIEQKFGLGWRDWRGLLRTLFDWHRHLRSFGAQRRMVMLSRREKGAHSCPALLCTSRLFPRAIIPIAYVQTSLSPEKKSGKETLSPIFSEGRGASLHKLSF